MFSMGSNMHTSGNRDQDWDISSIKQFFEEDSRELKNISENDLIARPELTRVPIFIDLPGGWNFFLFFHLNDFSHNFILGLSIRS